MERSEGEKQQQQQQKELNRWNIEQFQSEVRMVKEIQRSQIQKAGKEDLATTGQFLYFWNYDNIDQCNNYE